MADTRQTAGAAPALALGEAFAPVPTAAWDALVRQDLKGADYHARLVWHTAEGIAVKPFYRSEDLSGLDAQLDAVPGVPPFIRGDATPFQAADGAGLASGCDQGRSPPRRWRDRGAAAGVRDR